MANQNDRSGSDAASSNQPKDAKHPHDSGGNMGACKSGNEHLGSEKPSEKDNYGSNKPQR